MMGKNIYFLPLCLGLIALPTFSQQTKKLTAEKHNEYGLIYTLPVTSFRVEIVVVKETKVAGPFSKYAKIFTSESNVISKNEDKWYIEKVNVTPYGIPDPDNRYLMQLKAGSPTFISVSEDNMLLSINKETQLPAKDTISITEIEGTPVNGKEYLEFVNEDFISAQSSYKQAQILAEELMEIRDSKISLTRGTAENMPKDGRQLEIMLASLEKQENAFMNAFTGSSWIEREIRTFSFTPEDAGRITLCGLNPTSGIVNANAPKSVPIYFNIEVVEEAKLPTDQRGEEKKLPKDAVMYCVPGTASISISYEGRILYEEDFSMSQFGMLFGLNPSVFTDKKEPSYAIFNSSTGALEELSTIKQ